MPNDKHFELFVFGDQTYNIQTKDLRNLVHDGNNDPVVVKFLQDACRALRNDLYQLKLEDRNHAPSITCVADLLLWKQGHCVPLDMAILSLYQLATFMKCVTYPGNIQNTFD